MKAVVAALSQEKVLVGAFSVIVDLRLALRLQLYCAATCCHLQEPLEGAAAAAHASHGLQPEAGHLLPDKLQAEEAGPDPHLGVDMCRYA